MIEYFGSNNQFAFIQNNSATNLKKNFNRKRKIETEFGFCDDEMNQSNEAAAIAKLSLPILQQPQFNYNGLDFNNRVGPNNNFVKKYNNQFSGLQTTYDSSTSRIMGSKKRKAEEVPDCYFPNSYKNLGAVDLSSNFQAPLAINPATNHGTTMKFVGGGNNNNTSNHHLPTHTANYKSTSNRSATADGDYQIVVGENLNSMSQMYEVLAFLGRGTFGQVVKCRCRANNRMVAIKILKNHPSYMRQGNVEIQILQTLSQEDTESHNIVRAIECFQHKNHMCLVFELLEQNLYEYLKSNKFRPMTLPEIRPIAQQVLTALSKLKQLHLIHADLKPENIMLVNPASGAMRFRVKVIDFGSACQTSKAVQNTYLQSRYYRAPEILLGLPFNEAIDMWSLGCVLAELFLGWPLYPGSSEYDQIRYIVETQGMPPADMMKNAGKVNRFFTRDNNYEWRLKTQDEYLNETGQRTKEARKYVFTHLDQIRNVSPRLEPNDPDYDVEIEDRKQFAHLLIQMLQMRPDERITPDVALNHSLINMSHLQRFMFNKRVRDSFSLMQVCSRNQNRSLSSNSLLDVPGQNIIPKLHTSTNIGPLSFDQSGSSHLLTNPVGFITQNSSQYFLENLAAHNSGLIIPPHSLMHPTNNLHQNRMLNPQMSLYDLVAVGSNALSILAAASQPNAARDLLHQAMVLQHQQSNQFHQEQAAATAAAALVLSNQCSDFGGMTNIYQKNPIYLHQYPSNYSLQNQSDNFISDSKFLANSLQAQLIQNCGASNWLEKSSMILPCQQSSIGSVPPFLNKCDSANQKFVPDFSNQVQIPDNTYLSQSNKQTVASLLAGFEQPVIKKDLNLQLSNSNQGRSNGTSLTALQEMLNSSNASLFNTMQSHQSQMAAALEAMQNRSHRDLNITNWNVLPNSNVACSSRNFLSDSLSFSNNFGGLAIPSSNYGTDNEISSYFNLFSKANHDALQALRQPDQKVDVMQQIDNSHNPNSSVFFNPNNLNDILPVLNVLQSQKSDVLNHDVKSTIFSCPLMMKLSNNSNIYQSVGSHKPQYFNSLNISKPNEVSSLHKPALSEINASYDTSVQESSKDTYKAVQEGSNSTNVTDQNKAASGLLNVMQLRFGACNQKVSSETSVDLKNSSIENYTFPTVEDNKDHAISSKPLDCAIKNTNESIMSLQSETTDINNGATIAADCINSAPDVQNDDWLSSCQHDNINVEKNKNKSKNRYDERLVSVKDSLGKDKKNVPVGRVQPMIKEELHSKSSSVSSNASTYNSTANNFDFSKILNTAANRISTIAALNGVNQMFSAARPSYQYTTGTTSSSQDSALDNGHIPSSDDPFLFNSAVNNAHHILNNPVFIDPTSSSKTTTSSFHQQRI